MDYETKPTSRRDLRKYASILRKILSIPAGGIFPVLRVLDLLPDVFPGSNYMIVDDKALPPKTMAQCTPNDAGGMTIEIKESVYDGAYRHHVGALLGFICHEICHVYLFYIGFTPIYARSFEDGTLPPYCSVEWQAKALCGEVMIPYEESQGMSIRDIRRTYQVSEAFAKHRHNEEKRRGGMSVD